MAQLTQAIEWIGSRRAGEVDRPVAPAQRLDIPAAPERRQEPAAESWGAVESVPLRPAHLEDNRIVAHDGTDERARAFDLLRTQILREMDEHEWQVLAVTSPTDGCGNTTTAVNLALSIARLGERPVVLVDLNLRKPQVARCLGLSRPLGILDHIGGRASLQDTLVKVEIGGRSAFVLPCFTPAPNAADLMGSSRAKTLLQRLTRDDNHPLVILDMPPLLDSHETIALLPEVNCALLVLASGHSTIAELDDCRRHLEATNVIQLVLNQDRG